jgi:exodeoxyribonuclease VII large subunit
MSELPVISVTELVSALKEVVETALPPCTVDAEISNCRRSPAGHWYLTLKDDSAEIAAVIWRSAAQRIRFEPKDGLKVLATGSLQVYVARGTTQFSITKLSPQGLGELELAFRQLRDKLAAEGLFDESRKRPLPRIPRRIALVTSPSGAALRDMIQVITRRWPPADLVVVPCRVQGDDAVPEIVQALQIVHRIPRVDVVICGRGGGSLEDLWCFNTEPVARAIAACQRPVISAVGHEIDVTIADLVADARALTPSEAGERVVPSAADLRATLEQTARRCRQSLRGRIEQARLHLAAIEARSVIRQPVSLIDQRRQTLDLAGDRLIEAASRRLETGRTLVATVAASLQALSPLHVLARGYSVTQTADGRVVRTPADVRPGDRLTTRGASVLVESDVVAVVPAPSMTGDDRSGAAIPV